jgi:hypothetical protein
MHTYKQYYLLCLAPYSLQYDMGLFNHSFIFIQANIIETQNITKTLH